jgi:hypothetical protein
MTKNPKKIGSFLVNRNSLNLIEILWQVKVSDHKSADHHSN